MNRVLELLRDPDAGIMQTFWENLPAPWEQDVSDGSAAKRCLAALANALFLGLADKRSD